MNLYVAENRGKGDAYVAPDSHFISLVSLFANSLPWMKFKKFFETKKLVKISADEHLILLRLVAAQELLCLNDNDLMHWSKNQMYLFGFMQPSTQPKLPSKELYIQFRNKLNDIGLLKPFRKQCQKLIADHETRFPPLSLQNLEKSNEAVDDVNVTFLSSDKAPINIKISNKKPPQNPTKSANTIACTNCGSQNIIMLTPSQEESTLPNIRFSRCRFCGNTFRS